MKFKTAFYSFYLPVALAMYMVSVCMVTFACNFKPRAMWPGHRISSVDTVGS